jgi:two-component system sensor histidine kinase KdpD
VVDLAGRGEAGRIVIEIRDEGDAIPPDELDKVFDRFHPLSRGAAEATGSGLGLAVCRGLIEAHGGTITAENRRDRTGAVFTIVLPAVRAGDAASGGAVMARGL